MNKRIAISILLAILIVGGALAYFLTRPNDQETNPPDTNTNTDTTSETTPGETYIGMARWDVRFKLPQRINIDETTIAYQQYDDFDKANILSNVLPEKLNKDMCMGTTLSLGSFVEISRYPKQDDDGDRIEINGYFYEVSPESVARTCYDEATYEKYFSDDVIEVVEATLIEA